RPSPGKTSESTITARARAAGRRSPPGQGARRPWRGRQVAPSRPRSLVAVPGMETRKRLEAPGERRAHLRDQLERVWAHFRRVDDRHHDARLDAGIVHPADALRGLELPAEGRKVVDVHVGVDNQGSIMTEIDAVLEELLAETGASRVTLRQEA